METLQVLSILIEAVIVIMAIMAAIKGKRYAWGFALTFAIYVFYDLARFLNWQAADTALYPLFFMATLSALVSMICIYKR
jgi:hypothetical protein